MINCTSIQHFWHWLPFLFFYSFPFILIFEAGTEPWSRGFYGNICPVTRHVTEEVTGWELKLYLFNQTFWNLIHSYHCTDITTGRAKSRFNTNVSKQWLYSCYSPVCIETTAHYHPHRQTQLAHNCILYLQYCSVFTVMLVLTFSVNSQHTVCLPVYAHRHRKQPDIHCFLLLKQIYKL